MTPAEALREKLSLTVFVDELFAQNCYLVRRRDTNRALLVDPGLQVSRVLEAIDREGLSLDRILLSHGHVDHIAGVPAVHAANGAPISMHLDDRAILDWERFAQYPFMPPSFAPFEIQEPLSHDMLIEFADITVRVLHTPGHTEGSICFLVGVDCLSGDTLFERGIGRTDLPGGDPRKIVFSIRNLLYALPPETVVYPGHGGRTTIGAEMLLNPFVPASA